jgi:hypothetical protein
MANSKFSKAGRQLAAAFSILLAGCATSRNGADSNGDGALSVAEFESVLLDRIMAYSDADGDGALSYAEWSTNYASADREKFRAADVNGDGKLDRDEAEATTKTSPLWQKLMAKIDLDGDGKISEAERTAFIDVMAKADDDDQVNMLRRIAEE